MDKSIAPKDHGAFTAHEISVDWNGWRFDVVYGKRKNGWFIAIPNWNVCIEAPEPTDIYYNTNKLSEALMDYNKGYVVAGAVKEHWEEFEK